MVRALSYPPGLSRPLEEFFEEIRRRIGRRLVIVDGWYQENVPASQTDVELTRGTGRFRCPFPGSVVGLVVGSTEARTAGTLTVEVYKNTGLSGAAGAQLGTLKATLDATNTSRFAAAQDPDFCPFLAKDELFLVITTTGAWTPTTADLRAALAVELDV